MKLFYAEKMPHFILLCVYTLCPPFYMMTLTYLLDTYQRSGHFILSQIIPVFWSTVWIPALSALLANFFFRRQQYLHAKAPDKVKDSPLTFIFLYAVYFIILGRISWGMECMYGGIGGLLVVLFAYLFRQCLRKHVEYLPSHEKFYAYLICFFFPILSLLITDFISVMQQNTFYMSVLLSPVIYIGGVSLFLSACVFLQLRCLYYHISPKKDTFSLSWVIGLLLIGHNAMFIYLIPYIGNTLFISGFLMSILLCFSEYAHHRHRWLKRFKPN